MPSGRRRTQAHSKKKERYKLKNPRGSKRGGRKSIVRGKNTKHEPKRGNVVSSWKDPLPKKRSPGKKKRNKKIREDSEVV